MRSIVFTKIKYSLMNILFLSGEGAKYEEQLLNAPHVDKELTVKYIMVIEPNLLTGKERELD